MEKMKIPTGDLKIMSLVGDVADAIGRECYVVGGYVRDLILKRHSKDIDFVTVGSGIELAQAVADKIGKKARLVVFKNFGTAQLHCGKVELEFVGARRESYNRNSRKPIVEDGTLRDDLSRRDFTVNALAIKVNSDGRGELVDMWGGLQDMDDKILRTPLDPDITFSDDPLRMMRAVRFATQLQFEIHPDTFAALGRNAERLKIISRERIADELMKIMASPRPSIGWRLLSQSGLLPYVLPQLEAMKGVETVRGRGHKDNFDHTMQVLDKVAQKSDNVWLRWSALLHDIAKPVTKRWEEPQGWTFHNHNFIGSKMIPKIFKELRLPMDIKMKYVQKMVELHMRPIALVEEEVTDSAVRRLIVDAGEDLDDLMTLCQCDITSKNPEKVRRHLANFDYLVSKMAEIEEKDALRNWQPPVDGLEIMETFALQPSREVGVIKQAIRDAILDGIIPNTHEAAHALMLAEGAKLGLTPITNPGNPDIPENPEK
ncbi:MAG: CCA tRNA nucleotidyltransferase [Bacteroidales bacterium]|nr:CCA tRNA nucleotidyltransferase [Bacteroidales bacterium]